MGKKIAIMGAGAVGSYVGAHMAAAGEDVTLIDPWPEHIEAIRANGLRVTHALGEPELIAKPRALHVTDAQQLGKEAPADIIFICMKSYDTAWATMLMKQYLAPNGFMVSLQNCMNEETVAGIVGWGRTLGCIASKISVEQYEPGLVHRGAAKGGAKHTVFRAGELHGRITDRVEEVVRLVAYSDSAMATDNLWGERWSKLVANCMQNGVSAATGMSGNQSTANDAVRRFIIRLGSEAIRVGQALGYSLEEVYHLDPDVLAKAGDGDVKALAEVEAEMFAATKGRSDSQRPSMGQDMAKGRRTEIEFLNGFVVEKGKTIGIDARANALLTDVVKKVERGELKQDPANIADLRWN